MTAEIQKHTENALPGRLILIFALLAAGILAAGYFAYRGYEKHYRAEVEIQLAAIAELKVDELKLWRGERQADAGIIADNATLASLVHRYIQDPRDSDAGQQVGRWLVSYPQKNDYDQIRLLDPQGVTRMSFPPGRPPASVAVSKRITEVIQSRQATMVDLYRHDRDQRIYLSVLVPILDAAAGNRAIAVIALRIDPEKFLYPFILRWPTPSPTAATVLVRRDGNDVLYLSDLKFQKSTALTHRYPLAKTEIPAVLAVLGRTGIVQGVDYQGEQVIADVRAVPDSPWFLVTRMNLSEVFAPARGLLWLIAGFVTALLFGAGAGLAFIWRQQSIGFFQERYRAAEALRESEHRVAEALEFNKSILKTSSVGILTYNATGQCVFCNEAAAKIVGTNVEALLLQNYHQLQSWKKAGLYEVALRALDTGVEQYTEQHIVTTFGKDVWLSVRFSSFQSLGEKHLLMFTYDITESMKTKEQTLCSLKEKEVLVKEIHHRVKNNMQVIYSLLNLQAQGIADGAVRALFEESRDRVNSMALIHERLYRSKDLAHVDFKAYLQSLVQGIASTYKRPEIDVFVDMESLALDVNAGIPCGLIVNELVSNSFKHAFPSGGTGTIRVGMNRSAAGGYVLTVADDGVGFPSDADFRKTSSLGLQLVNVLVGQIHGTIELALEKGTRFVIAFPGTPAAEERMNG